MPEKIPIPSYEEMFQKFVVENNSVYALHKYYSVSHAVVNNWCLYHGLHKVKEKYLSEQKALQEQNVVNAEFVENGVQNEWGKEAEAQRGGFDEDEQALSLPSSSLAIAHDASGSNPSHFQPINDPDEQDLTPYGQCSRRQQRFINVFVENIYQKQNLTHEQIAEKSAIAVGTLYEYLKNDLVRQAIVEMNDSNFNFELSLNANTELLNLYANNKLRPEDRKLAFELLGRLSGNTINLNISTGHSDKRINKPR